MGLHGSGKEMTNVTIVHALDWATVRRPAAVLELVHEIQTSPPYCYGPDEAAPVARWFPALLARADQALLAYGSDRVPVG